MKRTLTLRPAPATVKQKPLPPPPNPLKIALSEKLGWRFVDRSGRYILQARTVRYEQGHTTSAGRFGASVPCAIIVEQTWVDVPLVPEVYG